MRRDWYGGSAWAVVLGHGRGAPLKTAVACPSSSQHWSQGDETSGMGMLANGKTSIHGITVMRILVIGTGARVRVWVRVRVSARVKVRI